ncbi:hypothetical protein PF005_g27843 [Phytophthora fragariae]|uniref:Peptidase S54 rhomboid domain-containing protein n=1 Tax=Phytophthora fragariae TaxID=53985 RepID=A0A6A3EQI1_9STRA|nr:hypothetical protein PF003_g4225 [Phytophthora fragariae]KAE8934657.1 hypothetical protein PF009_g15375 [Phytophthora fragariae]KAE9003062.1 hypothetical protein PF011_g13054 [Phytophthora fragariae]KAE9056749.1 hypothetical protein PF010_g31645 [Phytophthora fragariae]KAE9065562.1 hypothetical protein PF006_g30444 [Phytophthora fragariae]
MLRRAISHLLFNSVCVGMIARGLGVAGGNYHAAISTPGTHRSFGTHLCSKSSVGYVSIERQVRDPVSKSYTSTSSSRS